MDDIPDLPILTRSPINVFLGFARLLGYSSLFVEVLLREAEVGAPQEHLLSLFIMLPIAASCQVIVLVPFA